MTLLQTIGIACLMISIGIFVLTIIHVLYAGIRRKSLNTVPMTYYAVVSIIACSTGLVLLLI